MPKSAQTVEELFEAALDLSPEQRGIFLESACPDQPDLRQAVEELFSELDRAGSFLNTPVLEIGDTPGIAAAGKNSPLSHPVAEEPPRFKAGQIIAHRFIVVDFLARGGMGEVYEVEDLWLHGTHVALKVIRSEIAADAGSSRRFEQEVLLARKVTHPNLCPIYEIFRCNEPGPPFLFLTMKLLRGDTLATRLRTPIPLTRPEQDCICRELTRGVAALHAGGIIHRDIKPGNVMLEATSTGLHVSLMDFGLARLTEAEPTVLTRATDAPGEGLLVAGTPGYLAPELLHGVPPDDATDLFALGVVLHQVLTGDRPSAKPIGIRSNALPLRISGASPDLIRTVEELLSDAPDRRRRAFARASLALDGRPATNRPQLTRRTLAFSSAAALCTLAAGVAWKRESLDDLLHPLPSKRFVALVSWPPGSDLTLRATVNAVLDAIASELTRAEALDHNFYIAAQTTATEVSTSAQLEEVRESLGANLVLAASGLTSGNLVRVFLQIIDPATRRPLRSRELEATRDHLFSLPARAVRAATELLDLHRFRPDDDRSRPGTGNREALAAFQAAEALVKRPNDAGVDEAIEKYRLATDLDPRFVEAHARLAASYLHLYGASRETTQLTLARANAETALVLDPNSVSGRMALGAYFNYTGLGANAVDQMSRALALDPTNPLTMLTQAQIYSDLSRWQDAEQAFHRLLLARPNFWPGYNEAGYTYNLQGRYQQALSAFQAASALAPTRALCFEGAARALFNLGRLPEALTTIDKSVLLARVATALQTKVLVLRLLGRHTEALHASQEAVQLRPNDGSVWLDLGDSFALLGHAPRKVAEAYAQAATVQLAEMQTDASDGAGWLLLALSRLKSGDANSVPSLLVRAEAFNAADIDSQLIKMRTQELLGQRAAAFSTLASCVQRGATKYQVEAMVDLSQFRADPRYRRIIAGQEQT